MQIAFEGSDSQVSDLAGEDTRSCIAAGPVSQGESIRRLIAFEGPHLQVIDLAGLVGFSRSAHSVLSGWIEGFGG